MKNLKSLLLPMLFLTLLLFQSCQEQNKTALQEQQGVEQNQSRLNTVQPPPRVTWSLERDNLIKRFKLQNDRTVVFYMYVFNYGIADPIGYYQVNKVSSVNSQLTNPDQIVNPYGMNRSEATEVLPSPQEDGSYGTNGDAVFSFTPDEVYIEHNMQYICSTVPLSFNAPQLAQISVDSLAEFQELMRRVLD